MAHQWPASGYRFAGALFFLDDSYQYRSFAEQAARGAFVFVNKFDPGPARPMVVNLEWWLAGVLGKLLGGHPGAGFGLLRLAAILALVAGALRVLRLAGLSESARGWGLALLVTGGGLGWLRLAAGVDGSSVPDVSLGLYPWHQMLFNGHFAWGTALLLWTFLLHLEWREGRASRAGWLITGWVLGLSRPYDLAAFVACAIVLALLGRRRARPWRAVLTEVLGLAGFAPVFLYYSWLVLGPSTVRGWGAQEGDLLPARSELLYALGPGLLLLTLFARRPRPEGDRLRETVWVWAGLLLVALAVAYTPAQKQFCTSLGTALLLGAALVTPPRALPFATLLLSPTSLFLLWRAFNPFDDAWTPLDHVAIADRLAEVCRPGELVATPPTDIGLMLAARTPCGVIVGHRLLTPNHAREAAAAARFYDLATDPAWREAYLAERRARYVVLPPGGGVLLGPQPPFAPLLVRPQLEVWRRFP